uniref:Ribonuclease H-like domain-containing protein n=1 Tax=Tanacetum cinerariifolium TaxID=118510 RepID=A0A699IPR4_TANCI|nr:ribonuclease H-like domain-containing protein [Tanacetum cinerariifolium]
MLLVTTDVPQTTVKSPKPIQHVFNKAHSPIRRLINHIPAPKNSNFHQKVTIVKAKKVNVVQGTKGNWVLKSNGNPQQALKDKGVIDNGCSRHMTGNISYLSDSKEINGRYVAFGGNPKGGKITSKGKIKTSKLDFDDVYFIKELNFNLFSVSQMCDKKNSVLFIDTKCVVLSSDFKLPDENHMLLRVPRENNMYNVDLNNVVPSGDLTYPLEKFDGKADEGFLVGYSVNSKAFRVFNSRTRIVQETLHINFLKNQPNVVGSGPKWLFDIDTLTQSMNYQPVVAGNQPNPSADPDAAFHFKKNENEVHVSPSSSDKPKKHDEKAKREAKGKNPVDLSTGVRDLRDEFEEFFVNSTNRVNAAGAPVIAVRPNPTNSTNSVNAASPSDNVVSLNFKIDDEEDVGAEDDFSNLETNISAS